MKTFQHLGLQSKAESADAKDLVDGLEEKDEIPPESLALSSKTIHVVLTEERARDLACDLRLVVDNYDWEVPVEVEEFLNRLQGLIEGKAEAKSRTIKDWADVKSGTKVRALPSCCSWSNGTTATFDTYDELRSRVFFRDIVSGTTGLNHGRDLNRADPGDWELVL